MIFYIMFFSILYFNFFTGSVECHTADLVESVQHRLIASDSRKEILSEELLQRSFPFLRSSCVRDALKSFLPICLKQGIESVDTSLKVETAVKLSICEFQVAGLGHIPDSCKESKTDSMMDCMIQLESSTQWWTTYSGNYQRLSSICFENSLPYEKEQILSLFLNITNVHNEINDNLIKHFYKLMSEVELSSDEHLRIIAQQFKDYLKQVDITFKAKEEEFKEYQDNMQDYVAQNSQLIKKQNVGFMQSMESLQHIVDNIIMDLKEDEISQQIFEIKNDNLNGLRQMSNLVQEIYQFQRHGQNEMNNEMELFFDNTRKSMFSVSEEVKQSHMRAVEILNVFEELQVSMLPPITEELIPQLFNIKEDLLGEWKSVTKLVNEDFQMWNFQINDTFQQISLRLNSTMETIDDIDRSLSKFEKILNRVSQLIGCMSTVTSYTLSAVYYFLTNRYIWKLTFIILAIRKSSIRLPQAKLGFSVTVPIMITIKCCFIALTIYSGSKLGDMIVKTIDT